MKAKFKSTKYNQSKFQLNLLINVKSAVTKYSFCQLIEIWYKIATHFFIKISYIHITISHCHMIRKSLSWRWKHFSFESVGVRCKTPSNVTTIGHEGMLYVTEGFAKARSWAGNPLRSIQNSIKKGQFCCRRRQGGRFFLKKSDGKYLHQQTWQLWFWFQRLCGSSFLRSREWKRELLRRYRWHAGATQKTVYLGAAS